MYRHQFCIYETIIGEVTKVCHIKRPSWWPRWWPFWQPSWILMFEFIISLWESHIWTPGPWKHRSRHQFCIYMTITGKVTKVCHIYQPSWQPSWISMFEALWECHIRTPWPWKHRSRHQFYISSTIIGDVRGSATPSSHLGGHIGNMQITTF